MKFENEIDFSSKIYIEIPFTWIEIDEVVVKIRKKVSQSAPVAREPLYV